MALIEPHIPPPACCGRTRETSMREVVNAIFYIAQTGCQWRLLPKPRISAIHHGAAIFWQCYTPRAPPLYVDWRSRSNPP